jgi:hypothetical protein
MQSLGASTAAAALLEDPIAKLQGQVRVVIRMNSVRCLPGSLHALYLDVVTGG